MLDSIGEEAEPRSLEELKTMVAEYWFVGIVWKAICRETTWEFDSAAFYHF